MCLFKGWRILCAVFAPVVCGRSVFECCIVRVHVCVVLRVLQCREIDVMEWGVVFPFVCWVCSWGRGEFSFAIGSKWTSWRCAINLLKLMSAVRACWPGTLDKEYC